LLITKSFAILSLVLKTNSKNIGEKTMNIPTIIKQQLVQQSDRAILWSWGISKWVALTDHTLALRVHARRLDGIVCITLDEGQDLYNITFFSNKRFSDVLLNPSKKYEDIDGVYCDQLIEVIDDIIERIPEYQF
jgi:hypothetical protein